MRSPTPVRAWLLRLVAVVPAPWVLAEAARGPRQGALLALSYAACVALVFWATGTRSSPGNEARGGRRGALLVAVVAFAAACLAAPVGVATTLVAVLTLALGAAIVSPAALLAVVTLAVSLAGAEAILRRRPGLLPYEVRLALPLEDRFACFFPTPGGCLAVQDLQEYRPDLAYLYKPRLNVLLKHPEAGFWTLRTDGRGFANGDDALYDRADVVVLGDSFVQGVLVEPDEAFPARLAALTALRVLNLGVAGYDAYQYPIAFRTYGRPARPRIVLVAIFGTNDWNNRFVRWDRFRAKHPGRTYRDFLEAQPAGAGTSEGLLAWPRRLYESSYLVGAVRGVGGADRAARAETDYDEVVLDGRTVRARLRSGLRLWRGLHPAGLVAAHREGIEQLERSAAELAHMARELEARLIVLYIPTMEEVYLPLVGAADPIWRGVPREPMLERFAALRAVVREHVGGAELLDLTPGLQEHALRGETLYWIGDPHWNRRGHAAVAAIVAARLREPPPGAG